MIATSLPQLQPLSMGQLLDRAIRLYRQNFWTFVGIVAITQIPSAIFGILVALLSAPRSALLNEESPFQTLAIDQPGWVSLATIILALLGFVLTMISYAAITQAVAHTNLGQTLTIGSAFDKAKSRWVALLIAIIVAGIFVLGVAIYTIIPLLGWFTGPGALIFFISVVVPLMIPIVILERKGAVDSLYRGWELARRRFWWLLGFTLILSLFSLLILQGPVLLLTFVLAEFTGLGLLSAESQIIQQVIATLLNTIYLPLQLTCYTLMYFDVRIRSEGLDLELAAIEEEPDTAVNIAQFFTKAPKASRDWMPSGQIWGWLVGLSFIIFALYGILLGIIFSMAFAISSGF